jgi:hypothetical protein
VPLDKSDHKVSLVKKTIEEKNIRIQNGEFDEEIDEAWVVLDRDANPLNKLDKAHFNQALELAKANHIFAAYSNDAFELWFLLHYQDLWTAVHRDQLCKMLSTHRNGKYVSRQLKCHVNDNYDGIIMHPFLLGSFCPILEILNFSSPIGLNHPKQGTLKTSLTSFMVFWTYQKTVKLTRGVNKLYFSPQEQ